MFALSPPGRWAVGRDIPKYVRERPSPGPQADTLTKLG